jgi:hypothetical protein
VWRHGGLAVLPIRWVLVRDLANRFTPQAQRCTGLDREPVGIVSWFVRRWSVEVTFQEAGAYLGMETQRQWSDMAIARTAPCLLALLSIETLLASRLPSRERARITTAASYVSSKPTFVDALAAVRYALWREQASVLSHRQHHRSKRRLVLPCP